MKKIFTNLSTKLIVFGLGISTLVSAQNVPDTILVSDDTYVQGNINVPGENGAKEVIRVTNGGDTWSGYKNIWSGISFFKFDISEIDTTMIDSVVFSVTVSKTNSFAEMNDPPVVTEYVAHVPVENGVTDNWDEETMYHELAVSFWSYGETIEGNAGLWFREALNDTSKMGSFDITSESDTIEPKKLNITDAVLSNESDYLTLSVYDRDRNPDVAGFAPERVEEGVNIYYRSKENTNSTKGQMPLLLVYTSSNTKVKVNPENVFNVYPNPAGNIINIDIQGQQVISLTIRDIIGRILYKTDAFIGERKQIDISGLQNGQYFIAVETAKNTFTKKFIKY